MPENDMPAKHDLSSAVSGVPTADGGLEALRQAYAEGFADGQNNALMTTADWDDIEPHWKQSVTFLKAERQP